ncbi:MAG: hypothetical protein DMF64_12440 [Acidobacteria bacterium]|nr:MAG: hypothetical protein DMF64_12440 [Acidobacteriota bacterium]
MATGIISRATHALRYFLLRRLPTCKQMSVVMSESLERRLTLRERISLRLHLWICIWCVWYLEHLHIVRDTLRARAAQTDATDTAAEPHLSLEARTRIKRTLGSNS